MFKGGVHGPQLVGRHLGVLEPPSFAGVLLRALKAEAK